MFLNLILISIIAICVFFIAYIVVHKFPKLKSLDVDTVPAAQTAQVRDRILIDRLKRRLEKVKIFFIKNSAPLGKFVAKMPKKFIAKIYALERKYQRESSLQKPLSGPELENNIRTLIANADDFIKKEEWREAEKILIEAIGLDPRNILAYNGLAEIYLRLKEYKQALQTRQFILKLILKQNRHLGKTEESDEVKLIHPNAVEIAGAYSDLGDVLRLMGKNDKALIYFQQALLIEPNSPRYINKILEIGIILKKKVLALDMLKQLEKVNPDNQKLKEYADKIEEM